MHPVPLSSPTFDVRHGRVVATAAKPRALPPPRTVLGVPRLKVTSLPDGRAELRGPDGESFGLFASKQLAESTRDFLRR